jgi:hypothetical protein
VILCRVANKIHSAALQYKREHTAPAPGLLPPAGISKYHSTCEQSSFHARENIAKFVGWARAWGVADSLLFSSDELISGNGKQVTCVDNFGAFVNIILSIFKFSPTGLSLC